MILRPMARDDVVVCARSTFVEVRQLLYALQALAPHSLDAYLNEPLDDLFRWNPDAPLPATLAEVVTFMQDTNDYHPNYDCEQVEIGLEDGLYALLDAVAVQHGLRVSRDYDANDFYVVYFVKEEEEETP